MRTVKTALVALFIVVLAGACGDVGDAPAAKTGEATSISEVTGTALPIDTANSTIKWRAAKVTREHDGGFNSFTGTVTLDSDQVTGVDVTIDAQSLFSDTERLTGHLKSDDFFKTGANPTTTFKSDSIVASQQEGATHTITGNLTMAGKTNSVTFPATITVTDGKVHATADFIINRQNWEMTYPGQPDDLIKDEVRIWLDINTVQ